MAQLDFKSAFFKKFLLWNCFLLDSIYHSQHRRKIDNEKDNAIHHCGLGIYSY